MKKNKIINTFNAVAYARFSSSNQREESIDAQFRAINEYCDQNNINLIETFKDEAVSGTTDNRYNFQRMINAIVKGELKVNAVLVHKFNRFFRDKVNSAVYKKKLKDVGVKVISVTQSIDDTPEGDMMESIIEAFDQYYSANLSVEAKKGLRENAINGKHNGGKIPLGFTAKKTVIIIWTITHRLSSAYSKCTQTAFRK